MATFRGLHRVSSFCKQIFRPFSTSRTAMSEEVVQVDDSEPRAAKSFKTEVNGTQLHYEVAGDGNHVVLLLPGALGCSQTDFARQLGNMNRDLFTLVAWDPRGYGLSRPPHRTWPLNFFYRDAEDAAKLMQNLDNSKQYSLVGWSDGGITALVMAGLYPERIRKMVIFGANAYVSKDDLQLYEKIRDTNKWSANMRQPFVDLYGEDYFKAQCNQWLDALIAIYKEKDGDICKSELSKISCPTLIIHGQKDPIVPQFHADYLHQHIKNSLLENWPDAKHNLHMKYFKKFNSRVEQFLLDIDSNL